MTNKSVKKKIYKDSAALLIKFLVKFLKMDVPYKDHAVKCTEVDSTKVEYALNSDKLHPSVVSAHFKGVSEPEPNEESGGIEEDLHIEPYADVLPVSSKTTQPTGAGAPRNEPPKKRMASAKATADVLPVSSKTTQPTGAGAARNEPPKKRMASAKASRTEGLDKRRTGAKDSVKMGLQLLFLLIFPGGVSSYELHDVRMYGASKLFEGEELRLFCIGCGVPGCSWYHGGYGEEITYGISYNDYGSELLIKNVTTQHAGSYICQKKVDDTDLDMMPVQVLPRVPDLKMFGPTRLMAGEAMKLVCLGGTETYLSIAVNGTEIHNGEKYELEPISGYGRMELRLLVPNVTMEDGGTYECIQDKDPERALLDIKIFPDLASPPEEQSNAKCGFGPTSTILLVVCVLLASVVVVLCGHYSCKGGRGVKTYKEYPPFYYNF